MCLHLGLVVALYIDLTVFSGACIWCIICGHEEVNMHAIPVSPYICSTVYSVMQEAWDLARRFPGTRYRGVHQPHCNFQCKLAQSLLNCPIFSLHTLQLLSRKVKTNQQIGKHLYVTV